MDKDYFNSLKNSVQDSERPVNNVINSTDQTLLTVKVDIDCKVYCDGEFLDLLEANKTKQFTIETGPHLITIESEKYEELVEDREIDAKGRNNLVVVKDMKQKEQDFLQKEKEEQQSNEKNSELEKQVCDFKEKEREGAERIILKRNTKIEYISHDMLAGLFNTALYGNTWLSAEWDKDFYNSLDSKKKKGDSFEDKLADVLLNGGEIYLCDNESEGEIYNNNQPNAVVKDKGDGKYTQYTITLLDIIEGLQRATNGTYKVQNDSKWVSTMF